MFAYSLNPLNQILSLQFVERMYTEERITGISATIDSIGGFVGLLCTWGLCAEKDRRVVRTACKELVDALSKSWSKALSARATRTKTGEVQSSSMGLTLSNVADLNNLFGTVKGAAREALRILEGRLRQLSDYVQGIHSHHRADRGASGERRPPLDSPLEC
jgi:hypothetical protein